MKSQMFGLALIVFLAQPNPALQVTSYQHLIEMGTEARERGDEAEAMGYFRQAISDVHKGVYGKPQDIQKILEELDKHNPDKKYFIRTKLMTI